jgi:hypothetical protein
MPIVTTLGQRCTVFLDAGGVQRFKIDSSIDSVLAGDLPVYGTSPFTSNVFVHKITVPADPKSDSFLRVANVADLTTLPLGREIAAGSGQSLYLSTAFTVTYDDIATASSAKLLIQQRVDNLIADWHAYNERFLAPAVYPADYSTINLPLTSGIVSTRLAAYNTAHAEYLASKVASASTGATATVASAAAISANEAAIDAVNASQQCSTLLGQFTTGNTAIIAYRGAVNAMIPTAQAFYAASTTYSSEVTAFSVAYNTYLASPMAPGDLADLQTAKGVLNTATAAWEAVRATFNPSAAASAMSSEALNGEPTMAAFGSSMSTACSTKINEVAIASQKKKDADSEAAAAATAKSAADATQSTALIADTAAFLSLKEVCATAVRTIP